ncbi:MAG: aldo/keto reductase [Rhodobiaceae bacterium]|nr:aldo/keto reductase [Rhodobiaceae bacterium]
MTGIGRRTIGKTSLSVSELGLGGAPLGDLYAEIPEEQARDTVVAAADSPDVTYFDTAPYYGHGLSEHRFGEVLRSRPRDSFQISTKVGRWLRPAAPGAGKGPFTGGLKFEGVYDYSYDGTMRAVEQSMARLALPKIDILLIHDVDVWTHGDQMEARYKETMEGCYKALEQLRSEGSVAAIGAGINESDTATRFARDGDFDCLLLAGRYTLIEQGALDEFFTVIERKSMSVISGGVFNSGILATGAVPGAKFDYNDAPPEIMARVEKIEAVCKAHNTPLAVASAQFPLGHPRVASVILGAVSRAEVERNVAAMSFKVPAGLWSDLKSEGLLRADAPTPGAGA